MNTAFDRGVDMAIALSSIPDLMTHNTGVSVSGRWLSIQRAKSIDSLSPEKHLSR